VVNRYDFKKEKGAVHPVHADAVLGLAITADGQRIISAGRDGKLWIGLRDTVSPMAEQVAAFSSETWITAVEMLDDTLFAMGNGAGELRLLDVTTASLTPPIAAHTGTVHGLVYLAHAGILVSLGEDAMVRTWHLRGKTLEPAGDRVQVTMPARLLRWRESEFALVSADGAIHSGQPGLGALRLLLRIPAEQKLLRNGPILAAMDPERSILAAVANDNELWAFNLETGDGARLTQTDSGFTALAFDPSGQLFVAQLTGLDVWDAVRATRAFSLPTGVRSIADFEPLPGPGLLVSTNSYNELTFWGLQGRGQIGPWIPLPGVDTAAILADARGQYLYTVVRSYAPETSTHDYQVYRWTLAVERWRALARRMANRDFIETELERFAP
jgi:WD40 repeat protein